MDGPAVVPSTPRRVIHAVSVSRMPHEIEHFAADLLARLLVHRVTDRHNLEELMFEATLEIAEEIAHDLNVRREFVWEIIKGVRYNSVEEL